MEIVNFFETLAGKWFSQRTTHHLTAQTSQAGQSNLVIEFLPPIDSAVVQLCSELSQDASQVLCGLRVNQDSRMDGDTHNTQTSTLLAALKPNGDNRGTLLQKTAAAPALVGHYCLENEVLTITTDTDAGQAEERLWYVNPNLRMRTSVLKESPDSEDVKVTSFCSEIRMGLSCPPES